MLRSSSAFIHALLLHGLHVVEGVAHSVLGQLLHLAARKQCAGAGLVLVNLGLGLKQHVHRLDVAACRKVLHGVGRTGVHADLECAEAGPL